MDAEIKQNYISRSVAALTAEYFSRNGRHAVSHEISDFARSLDRDQIIAIISKRQPTGGSIPVIPKGYDAFWDDLSAALEQIKIPMSIRAARTVG